MEYEVDLNLLMSFLNGLTALEQDIVNEIYIKKNNMIYISRTRSLSIKNINSIHRTALSKIQTNIDMYNNEIYI